MRDWDAELSQQSNPKPSRSRAPVPNSVERGWMPIIAALVGLVLLTIWVARVEQRIPNLRAASRMGSAAPRMSVVHPGTHPIVSESIGRTGDWHVQQIGEATSLVSSDPSSTLRLRFYGTDADLLVRVGPEAGRAYVTVDGETVPGLPSDDRGSFVRLRAIQAVESPVGIASGLAHREHLLEISPGGNGELAVSAIVIRASTPFPWAFLLLYAAIAVTMFVIFRRIPRLLPLDLQPATLAERGRDSLG